MFGIQDDETCMRKVALIGSSGGGTATLGHTQPSEFLRTVEEELGAVAPPVRLHTAVFVALVGGQGMDHAEESDSAILLHLENGTQRLHRGSLGEMNKIVKSLEAELARKIQTELIDALICVSCAPDLFSSVLTAASDRNIPVTGTGGTSLSLASSIYQIRLVGNAGGSVATTPHTKAISFAHALSSDWDDHIYQSHRTKRNQNVPTCRSVLNSCLPCFWGVTLCKRVLLLINATRWSSEGVTSLIQTLETNALPVTCAVVMGHARRPTPSVLMGSILAASVCQRSIVGGLLAGWLVATLEEQLLYLCIIRWSVPATMTNLLTTGLVGSFAAMLLLPIAPYMSIGTSYFRQGISHILSETFANEHEYIRLLAMSLLGSFFCYGSKVGWYHSFLLPLILVEMEVGDPAILGAIDQLTLVLVSAGICVGVCAFGSPEDTALVKRGLRINLLYGDFIEACYPFMEQSSLVSVGGYLASACSVACLTEGCKSSAYLPFPVAVGLAEDWKTFLLSSFVAVGISFGCTTLHFAVKKRRQQQRQRDEAKDD